MSNAYRRPGWPPAAVFLLLLAGCAASGPTPVEPDLQPIAVEASPIPVPPPAPAAAPPEPEPSPAPASARETPRAEIALVVDTSAPVHAAVAEEIFAVLPPRRFRVERYASTDAAGLEALRGRKVTIAAVGPAAARAARAALPDLPLVFCQVPGRDEALLSGGKAWGVESLPPLELQLKQWRNVDPTLRTIALIVNKSQATLASEAQRAAAALATDLLVETSASDRETLYLFRRLATTVDGLWLLPDNEALSPQVLGELLTYAASRGVGVLTFNEALLARGALLTATAIPADIAAAMARVVERVATGRTADLPAMTPLSAAELAVNSGVATTLGLPPIGAERWVAREPD
jgi:hypothetical protein